MEKQQPYHYSSADIQKYLSGKMYVSEMHDMESAALNDPLLSDAIDGFSKHAVSESELITLKDKILHIRKPGQNNSRQVYFYLSIAASLFFIMFFGYQYLGKDKEEKILMAQKETIQKIPTHSPASIETTSQEKTKKENVPAIIEDKQPVAVSKQNATIESTSADNALVNTITEIHENSIAENEDIRIVENIAPQAVAKDEKPANVQFKSDAVKLTATLDDTKEEVSTKSVAVVKTEPQIATKEKVVLKKSKELSGRSESYPIMGWGEYQQYINQNIKPQIDNAALPVKGTVVLAFKVNKKGKPISVRIIQSLCKSCDQEAIRLIDNGPKWKKADNNEVNYSIIF